MKYKLEYSQIVKRKLKSLKKHLSAQYGEEFAKKSVKKITNRARDLQANPELGIDLSSMFKIETNFRKLFVNHNHLFYCIDENKVIIAEMFDEKEDFMNELFVISSRTQESIDYWGE